MKLQKYNKFKKDSKKQNNKSKTRNDKHQSTKHGIKTKHLRYPCQTSLNGKL